MAAVAVDIRLPRPQDPQPPPLAAGAAAAGSDFLSSCGSELVALGVKLAW